jgi:hypothetical protein
MTGGRESGIVSCAKEQKGKAKMSYSYVPVNGFPIK